MSFKNKYTEFLDSVTVDEKMRERTIKRLTRASQIRSKPEKSSFIRNFMLSPVNSLSFVVCAIIGVSAWFVMGEHFGGGGLPIMTEASPQISAETVFDSTLSEQSAENFPENTVGAELGLTQSNRHIQSTQAASNEGYGTDGGTLGRNAEVNTEEPPPVTLPSFGITTVTQSAANGTIAPPQSQTIITNGTTAPPAPATSRSSVVATTRPLPVVTTARPSVATTARPPVVTTALPPVATTVPPPVVVTDGPTDIQVPQTTSPSDTDSRGGSHERRHIVRLEVQKVDSLSNSIETMFGENLEITGNGQYRAAIDGVWCSEIVHLSLVSYLQEIPDNWAGATINFERIGFSGSSSWNDSVSNVVEFLSWDTSVDDSLFSFRPSYLSADTVAGSVDITLFDGKPAGTNTPTSGRNSPYSRFMSDNDNIKQNRQETGLAAPAYYSTFLIPSIPIIGDMWVVFTVSGININTNIT